jgi:transcriptional regulator with XRE-family HTH domain
MFATTELGFAVRVRRSDMGLTQAAVATLSGLSRATVNQVENGTIKDLSLTRASKLLEALGLSLMIAAPRQTNDQSELGKSPALEIAARTASTSYRTPIRASELRKILATGIIPSDFLSHVNALLEEGAVSLLAKVVDQLHAEDGLERTQVWKQMRNLARGMKSNRDLWQ